ncbi:MAG TPA: hypothetical protein DEO49_05600 [Sutterella sp.]|nr:hypothetical protein [Sutterella sp.]
MRLWLALVWLAVIFSAQASLAAEGAQTRPIRIGLIELSYGRDFYDGIKQSMREIGIALAPRTVEFAEYSTKDLERQVKTGQVDAFIASAGFYWRMRKHGAKDLANVVTRSSPDPNAAVSVAFLVKAANPQTFDSLDDLEGTRLGASYPSAFMGYRIGLAEIALRGHDPEKFFRDVVFSGTPRVEDTVRLLDDNRVQSVIVRSCWLEAQSPEVRARYRVLEPQDPDVGSRCLRTSRLYPSVTFAVTQGAPADAALIMARTLLNMKDRGNGFAWGVATDLRSIDRVYRELRIEHYEYLREWSVKRWVKAHMAWIVLALGAVFGLAVHSWRASILVRRRTEQLHVAFLQEKKTASQMTAMRERMEGLQKVSLIGQLSSMIAHELSQPVAAMRYFCSAQRAMLRGSSIDPVRLSRSVDGIQKGLERTTAIIDKVRGYIRGSNSRNEQVPFDRTFAEAVGGIRKDLRDSVKFHAEGDMHVSLRGDPLEMELIFYNLIKNAMEAAFEAPDPRVEVAVSVSSGRCTISVSNSGVFMDESQMRVFETPMVTTKADGHGLGVSIVRSLAEGQGGHVQFKARAEGGVTATVVMNVWTEPERLSPSSDR